MSVFPEFHVHRLHWWKRAVLVFVPSIELVHRYKTVVIQDGERHEENRELGLVLKNWRGKTYVLREWEWRS